MKETCDTSAYGTSCRCCTQGCDQKRKEGRIWCDKHDRCAFCKALAVEGRGRGEPRCEEHAEK